MRLELVVAVVRVYRDFQLISFICEMRLSQEVTR